MDLEDQIIDAGPYVAGQTLPFHPIIAAAELNALRDQLIELRQLKAAAEARERFDVYINFWDDRATLDHRTCGAELQLDDGDTLAELNRRAGEHTEVCR